MPFLKSTTRTAAQGHGCALALSASHVLALGQPSHKAVKLARLLPHLDITLATDLVFSLSGELDGTRIPSQDLLNSDLAIHVVSAFTSNAAHLGVSRVSDLYFDDVDDTAKFTLTPARTYTPISSSVQYATLTSINLKFSWKLSSRESPAGEEDFFGTLSSPFSHRLALPFQVTLNDALNRFMTYHFVKRYPLIFGPWSQQLDLEVSLFPSLFRSIQHILKRSPNAAFQTECRRLLSVIKMRQIKTLSQAEASLGSILGQGQAAEEERHVAKAECLSTKDAFCLSLEKLYKTRMRQPLFKPVNSTIKEKASDDELIGSSPVREDPHQAEESLFSEPAYPRFEDLLLQHSSVLTYHSDSAFQFGDSDGNYCREHHLMDMTIDSKEPFGPEEGVEDDILHLDYDCD